MASEVALVTAPGSEGSGDSGLQWLQTERRRLFAECSALRARADCANNLAARRGHEAAELKASEQQRVDELRHVMDASRHREQRLEHELEQLRRWQSLYEDDRASLERRCSELNRRVSSFGLGSVDAAAIRRGELASIASKVCALRGNLRCRALTASAGTSSLEAAPEPHSRCRIAPSAVCVTTVYCAYMHLYTSV